MVSLALPGMGFRGSEVQILSSRPDFLQELWSVNCQVSWPFFFAIWVVPPTLPPPSGGHRSGPAACALLKSSDQGDWP